MSELYVREELSAANVPAHSASEWLRWAEVIAGEAAREDILRNKEGRKTLRFKWGQRSYFLKLHSGVGWGEIVKNLLQLRLPVLGASNEYRAVRALQEGGVDTMSVAAYACLGANPAARRSLIVTDDLVNTVSLENYCALWASQPPALGIRLKLLRKLAQSARRMHELGINHRDFYICHFHLDTASLARDNPACHLIDLHRAQLRRQVPYRWRVKDLAGLYFSAMDCGLRRRDLLRFMSHYTAGDLRQALGPDAEMWRDVDRTARKLYHKEHGREAPVLPGGGMC